MATVVKMVAISDEGILAALVARAEPRLRRRFRQVIAWLKSRHDTETLAALVRAGRAATALGGEDLLAAANALAETVNDVYLTAAKQLAAHLAENLGEMVHVDQTLDRVVRQLQDQTRLIARELTLEQENVVRQVITDGVIRGVGPREIARGLRESIGLTARQEETVANYRRLLETGSREALARELRDRRFDASVRRAVAGEPLSPEQVERMVGRYRERMLGLRAEAIARTTAIGAIHRGTDEMWTQALERGVVDAAELEATWRATHDGRTRSSHMTMDGQTQPFGHAFVSGDGYALRYPHDPAAPASETANCRCARVVRYRAAVQAEPDLAQAA